MLAYYFIKSYQRNLKEKKYIYPNGFSLFTPFKKTLFIASMLLSVLTLIALGVISFGSYEYKIILTYCFGFFTILIFFVMLFAISGENKAKFQYEYLKYNQKLDILLDVIKEYRYDSEKCIKEIIYSIECYLDRKKQQNKTRNNIILVLLSAFGSLSIAILSSMNYVGITFIDWIGIVIIGFVLLAYFCLFFIYRPQSKIQKEYGNLIDELQDIIIREYSVFPKITE